MPEGGQQVRGSGVSEQVPHNAVEAVGFLVGVFGQGTMEGQVQEAFEGWPARRAPVLRALRVAGVKARLSRAWPLASG
jgi:hypothetical protein